MYSYGRYEYSDMSIILNIYCNLGSLEVVISVIYFPTKLYTQHGCFIRVGTEEVVKDIPHLPWTTHH